MNAARRKAIAEIAAKLEELAMELVSVMGDEQDALDGMPESLQNGERGEKAEVAIAAIEALESLLEAVK